MTKYIIKWNIGYGPSYKVVEANTKSDADDMAYEEAREEFENSVEYQVYTYSPQKAEELGADE